MDDIATVDFSNFEELNPANCQQLAASLQAPGCVIVRDPRIDERDNERFLDVMERYFSQPVATKLIDARPELHYQVNWVLGSGDLAW